MVKVRDIVDGGLPSRRGAQGQECQGSLTSQERDLLLGWHAHTQLLGGRRDAPSVCVCHGRGPGGRHERSKRNPGGSHPAKCTSPEQGSLRGLQLPLQLTLGLGCSATRDCFKNKRGNWKKRPAWGGVSSAKQAGTGIICSPYANLLCHCRTIFRSLWRI